jgi:16S rRNA (guanine527-N7)-methyltransferase
VPSLRAVSKQLRIGLTAPQIALFGTYLEQLIAENTRAGLTSLRDRESIQQRHFAESLALLRALEDARAFASPAIDVGAGAGFPGVPIKIARPETRLTLLEATGKKAAFLERLVARLGLEGVTVINGRAETLAHEPEHRESYKLALARAVAPLRTLVELTLPFLEVGGVLATPKGSGARREVAEAAEALKACGGAVELLRPLDLPAPGPVPTLVLVRKVAHTPDNYPRRPGMPSKRPL